MRGAAGGQRRPHGQACTTRKKGARYEGLSPTGVPAAQPRRDAAAARSRARPAEAALRARAAQERSSHGGGEELRSLKPVDEEEADADAPPQPAGAKN